MILDRVFPTRGDTIRFPAKEKGKIVVPINKHVSAVLYAKQGKDPRRWTLQIEPYKVRVRPSFLNTNHL